MRDLPNDKWYQDAFCFIKSEKLKNRLIAEFKNVRLIYKIFEGLSAEDELLLAEVRMQILMYASIYEAVIHYVLFDEYYKENPQVKKLLVQKVRKQFDIPSRKKPPYRHIPFRINNTDLARAGIWPLVRINQKSWLRQRLA